MPDAVHRTDLPEIDDLRKKTQSLAVIDLILCKDWEYRIYLFDSKWSETEQMACISADQGDSLFIVFAPAGCFIVGFAHETVMSQWARDDHSTWPGIFELVPLVFQPFVDEPAFDTKQSSTFCVWRQYGDPMWSTGNVEYPDDEVDPDGSEWMLDPYKKGAEYYQQFASDYFEKQIELPLIEHIYAHERLTPELITELNSQADVDWVLEEAKKIGYPTIG